ncbi:MAG TPA: CAP domain-containing protein [Saprospiraceae bacterium]|nr:hypothetical protein [Saprospiraceae bacterium]HRO09149.1 CAP domain-containing protein [Saprospiraceae bacterium]HRP42643.1 CAP domain-containing protein [Saprospiraceae bacterium]
MIVYYLLIFLTQFGYQHNPDVSVDPRHQVMLDAVNDIRTKGCKCGRRNMRPVGKVSWNELLYKSAFMQAKDMHKNHFIKHYSSTGKDLGERLDLVGYPWKVAGENLGRGQDTFDEVLEDWLKSYGHCVMLMNPKVEEMAIARVGNYWVQQFGKQTDTVKQAENIK